MRNSVQVVLWSEMATSNSLDDIFSTEIDENAVNALVGSLETQLASTTHKDTALSISDASMNNNHISNASAPIACTSSVYLHSIPTSASKNMTIQNNVALNNANISHLKVSQSESQLLGLNSIVSNVNSSEGGDQSVNANNINRNSPVPVNHVRIVSQSPNITNSRTSPSPSVTGHLNNVSVPSSTPNQIVINNGQGLPNVNSTVNSASSANFNAIDHKPVIRGTHSSPLNKNSSQDVKPGPTQIVNLKHEPVGSPQTGVYNVKQETGSPSSGFGVKQEHQLAIQPVPGAPQNVPHPSVHVVQGKGPLTGNPSVITVRTPGQTHPSQVIMQPQIITTQSSSAQMHVVSVSGCTVSTRPTGTVQVTHGKNINPRMATAAHFRPQQISIAPRPGTTV